MHKDFWALGVRLSEVMDIMKEELPKATFDKIIKRAEDAAITRNRAENKRNAELGYYGGSACYRDWR